MWDRKDISLNINSIHAYNGVKNKNAERLEKGNNNNNNLRHPLMMENSVAFKDATNPSTIERLIKQIKNFDYMSTLGKGKQWIEKMGFFVLFLIQDVIGMTIPRTLTGFNRDREVTGKFHIQEGLEVTCTEMNKEEAIASGAECMFIEKYPDIVTVYKIGDVSKELCGGPHVRNTRELGTFKIKKEEASSAGVRRIKAVLVK